MTLPTIIRPLALAAVCLTMSGTMLTARAADDQTPEQKKQILEAIQWATPIYGEDCDFARDRDGVLGKSAYFEIKYRDKGQDQDSPDNIFPLVQLYCFSGAYQSSYMYLTRSPGSPTFSQISFAMPRLDYDYTDENFSKLKGPPRLLGYVATTELTEPDFDPESKTISMHAKWRGLGDAWSSGVWAFEGGEFILKEYYVDPTYDLNADIPDGSEPPLSDSYEVYPQIKLIPND